MSNSNVKDDKSMNADKDQHKSNPDPSGRQRQQSTDDRGAPGGNQPGGQQGSRQGEQGENAGSQQGGGSGSAKR